MKKQMIAGAVALALCHPVTGLGAKNEELAELMRQVQQMREEYEQRISALEARLKAAEAAAKQAESTAKKAQSVAEKVEVKEKKSALDEAVAELEAEETQPAVAATPPSRDLWSRRIGGAEVRLLDISLNLMGAAGGSTANNSEIKLLHGGEHDPRRRGFTFQQAELSFAAAVDPLFQGRRRTSSRRKKTWSWKRRFSRPHRCRRALSSRAAIFSPSLVSTTPLIPTAGPLSISL